jgi:hypothetical protein
MVWLLTKSTHHQAIGPWVRSWLKGSATDRLIQISTPGLVWAMLWAVLAYAGDAEALFFLIGLAPWYFWALDAIVDRYATGGEIGRLMARDDVALATRAEYVGGHPQLPHGRFAYLTISGHQQNPMLTIWFPGQVGAGDSFDIPLLDISKTAPKADKEQSPTETLLATLSERAAGLFGGERVTLNVDYQGAGGRKHRVEFTSFFRGADEIRNWRNYLVCAQAEADTGTKPFGPWKSLKSAPEEVRSDDGARDGDKVSAKRRAFERR